jgi:hypothetical protein
MQAQHHAKRLPAPNSKTSLLFTNQQPVLLDEGIRVFTINPDPIQHGNQPTQDRILFMSRSNQAGGIITFQQDKNQRRIQDSQVVDRQDTGPRGRDVLRTTDAGIRQQLKQKADDRSKQLARHTINLLFPEEVPGDHQEDQRISNRVKPDHEFINLLHPGLAFLLLQPFEIDVISHNEHADGESTHQ